MAKMPLNSRQIQNSILLGQKFAKSANTNFTENMMHHRLQFSDFADFPYPKKVKIVNCLSNSKKKPCKIVKVVPKRKIKTQNSQYTVKFKIFSLLENNSLNLLNLNQMYDPFSGSIFQIFL